MSARNLPKERRLARPRPAPSTNAYRVFRTNIARAQAFLRIFDKLTEARGRGQPANDEKELLRGSLVFAIGALDAYLSDVVLEVVPEFNTRSRQLGDALKAIAKTDPGLSLRIALIDDPAERKGEFRTALGEWLETKSFHGPEKVQAALSYIGCLITWQGFDNATNVDTASELTRITGERHRIVHRGAKPYVKRSSTKQAHDLVETVAKLIDDHVCQLRS